GKDDGVFGFFTGAARVGPAVGDEQAHAFTDQSTTAVRTADAAGVQGHDDGEGLGGLEIGGRQEQPAGERHGLVAHAGGGLDDVVAGGEGEFGVRQGDGDGGSRGRGRLCDGGPGQEQENDRYIDLQG